MRKIFDVLMAAVMGIAASSPATAQTSEVQTRTTTRIEIDGGRDVTLVGCVQETPDGSVHMLTNVGTTMGGLKSYHLVVDDEDDSEAEKLEEYVGHKVEIRGKATDEGDATVKQTTKVKIEGPGGDRETETEGKLKADADGVPFLGVESVRRISKSCP